eukprot:g171.t1
MEKQQGEKGIMCISASHFFKTKEILNFSFTVKRLVRANILSKATVTKFEHPKVVQGFDLEAHGLERFAFTTVGLGGSESLVKLFDEKSTVVERAFCAGAVFSSGTRAQCVRMDGKSPRVARRGRAQQAVRKERSRTDSYHSTE